MKRSVQGALARNLRLLAVLCVVVPMLLITLTPTVRGQEAAGTPSRSATPQAMGTAVPGIPRVTATPATGGAIPGTLAAFGYDDVTAQGMYASISYYVPLPPSSVAAADGELHLVYSHSPLLVPDLSTMTVIVNGQSVESVRLASDNQARASLSVPLPIAGFTGNTIAIRIAFHLRLTRDQCEVTDDPALWASIHKESSVSFVTESDATAPLLTDLPRLFQTRGNGAPVAPAIVLPKAPGPEELDAAGIVAYQFGRWSGLVRQDPMLGTLSTAAPSSQTAAILVGQGKDLPLGEDWGALTWNGSQYLLNDVPVPADSGVLALRQQPVPHLLVSGASPEAVRKAALALTHPLDDAFFDSSVVVIGDTLPAVADTRYGWSEGAASFAQLGTNAQEITGPGQHYVDLRFERPAGWVLREGGTLQLGLEVSPGVRPETSWVRAVVNGVDIGSLPLREAEKGVNRYVFVLPAGRLNNDLDGQPVRQLTVQLRLYLDAPRQSCEAIDPQNTWASLLPTSAWVLPHDDHKGMDIGRFPGVLQAGADQPAPGIVVPDNASADELLAAFQVSASVGRWDAYAPPTIPQTTMPGSLPDRARKSGSLVLIGGPDRNPLTREVGADTLKGLEPAAYTDAPVGSYGVLKLDASPWADDRYVLVVAGSGEQDGGELLAAAALGQLESLSAMQGTGIVVTGSLAPQSLIGAEPRNAAPNDLAPHVIKDQRPWIERVAAWQIVGAILLITFVVLVVGVVTLRWVRAGNR